MVRQRADLFVRRFRRFPQIGRGPADAGRITRRRAMTQETATTRETHPKQPSLSLSRSLESWQRPMAAPRARFENAQARLQNSWILICVNRRNRRTIRRRAASRTITAARPSAYDPNMPNRLAAEQSPYLLQHAHNPVDWYPWGDEA